MDTFSGVGAVLLMGSSQLFAPGAGLAFVAAARLQDVSAATLSLSSSLMPSSSFSPINLKSTLKDRFSVAYTPPNKGGPRRGTGGSGTR